MKLTGKLRVCSKALDMRTQIDIYSNSAHEGEWDAVLKRHFEICQMNTCCCGAPNVCCFKLYSCFSEASLCDNNKKYAGPGLFNHLLFPKLRSKE